MPVISVETQRSHLFKSITDWSESLVFRPNPGDNSDPGHEVTAIVTRNDVAALEGLPSSGAPAFKVMVVHEPSQYSLADAREFNGINFADIRLGVSTLDIATKPGGTAEPRAIRRLDDSDEAALYLECR